MSKIALLVRDLGPKKTAAILRIREETSLPVAEVTRRVQNAIPIIEKKLFYSDHREIAAALTALVRDLPLLGAEVAMFEIRDRESYSPEKESGFLQLSSETLQNILTAHNAELERQRELGFEEGDTEK